MARGVKLTPLLQQLGLSKGNLSNWKKGGMPSADVLARLADALDCSTDFLLGRVDYPELTRRRPPEDSGITTYEARIGQPDLTAEELADIRRLLHRAKETE